MDFVRKFNNRLGLFNCNHSVIWGLCLVLLIIVSVRLIVSLVEKNFTLDIFFSGIFLFLLFYIVIVSEFKNNMDNYLVAINFTEEKWKELKKNGKLTEQISSKISVLIEEARTIKNPKVLNNWIAEFMKIEEMKKEKEEAEKNLREASGKINSLTTKIYYTEQKLFS